MQKEAKGLKKGYQGVCFACERETTRKRVVEIPSTVASLGAEGKKKRKPRDLELQGKKKIRS